MNLYTATVIHLFVPSRHVVVMANSEEEAITKIKAWFNENFMRVEELYCVFSEASLEKFVFDLKTFIHDLTEIS